MAKKQIRVFLEEEYIQILSIFCREKKKSLSEVCGNIIREKILSGPANELLTKAMIEKQVKKLRRKRLGKKLYHIGTGVLMCLLASLFIDYAITQDSSTIQIIITIFGTLFLYSVGITTIVKGIEL